MSRPMTAPATTQIWPPSALTEAAWPTRKSDVSTPSRMTATKARQRERDRRPVVERTVHRGLELALDAPRLTAHPEQHPGHDTGREDQRRRLEQLLVGLLEAADRDVDPDAEDGRERDGDAGPEEDLRDVARVAGPREIGADDGHDERRLDPLAKAGQQAAGERTDVHQSAGWAMAKASVTGEGLPGSRWLGPGDETARPHEFVVQGRLSCGL